MKSILTKTLFLILLPFIAACSNTDKLILVTERAWAKNSINTTVFRNQSVVTYRNKQYTSFYDENGTMILASRRLNSSKWKTYNTNYKGNVKDAHNVISLGVDGEGILHVAWNHHGNQLHYASTKEAGGLELGEMQNMTGTDEDNVTYPEFYTLPNGDLLFAYRNGKSGNGDMVLNRYDTKNKKWHRVQDNLIDGQGERNAYWQMCIDQNGGIHVSWVWRETYNVETNHDLCYAYSPDRGENWFHSDRITPYELPITAKNAEYICRIPCNSELINQTSMTCDNNTMPYIVTYWRKQSDIAPQYRIIWYDGQEWQENQVSQRTMSFSLSGAGSKKIPISRPRLAVETKRDGKINAYMIFRDKERGSKVSLAECRDLSSGKWNIRDLTDFSVESWEPSYDTKLWTEKRKLHIFVQYTGQGDGEQLEQVAPQPVYILETCRKNHKQY